MRRSLRMWLLMLEYPKIDSEYILEVVGRARLCQAAKMYKYYRKLVGGLTCSNIEQIKVTLLTYVLEQTYKLDLTCLNSIPSDQERTYAELFTNYLIVECSDCSGIFSGPLSSISETELINTGTPGGDENEGETTETNVEGDGVNDLLNYILLEDGTYITLENESGSHLMENN